MTAGSLEQHHQQHARWQAQGRTRGAVPSNAGGILFIAEENKDERRRKKKKHNKKERGRARERERESRGYKLAGCSSSKWNAAKLRGCECRQRGDGQGSRPVRKPASRAGLLPKEKQRWWRKTLGTRGWNLSRMHGRRRGQRVNRPKHTNSPRQAGANWLGEGGG
jgi:hypothetical protein